MERLTEKRESGAWPKKGWTDNAITECLDRLASIEDILGDEYDFSAIAPVVRCKDCRYYQTAKVNEKGFLICPASGMEITETDYCSYGQQKEAAHD